MWPVARSLSVSGTGFPRGSSVGTLQCWSWSGGWQWAAIDRFHVYVSATPFYKGKHNLKYDYLVL